jgi:hypothetical protein
VGAVTEQLQCRHDPDMSRPATRRSRSVIHCPYCHGARRAPSVRTGARADARPAAYGDVFSGASEARVCELVLGDRRHGLDVTAAQP